MNMAIGIVLVLVSGVMAGSSLAPIKFMRRYRFENYWLINNITGTIIIPWLLAIITVPRLFEVYSTAPLAALVLPPLFAFSWGIAATLGGLCVSLIGLSLTYALVIGFGGSVGALIPLLYFSPGTVRTHAGFFVLAGMAVMVVGLAFVTRAGRQKERAEQNVLAASSPNPNPTRRSSFLLGLVLASLAGLLSAGLNFSFAFGQPIAEAAVAAGASKANSTYAVWSLAMLGGMIPNVAYALIRCCRNNTWNVFAQSPLTDIPLSMLMGLLFMASTACYGQGAVRLGALGMSVGWGIMQIMQIVVGNVSGLATGEWKEAGISAKTTMLIGVAVLVLASILMAYGNHLRSL